MALIDGGTLVVKALKNEGISHIHGQIGFYVSPIFAACSNLNLPIYDTRHEQAAVHMAEGYAQVTGKIGVAVLTGGPGFINAIGGIVKCYESNTPVLVIIGAFDPGRKDVGGLEDINQLDIIKQHVNWCATIYNTKRIPEYISMAIRNAYIGQKGPVVLEIPIPYLLNKVEETDICWPHKFGTDAEIYGDVNKIKEAVKLLYQAERPVILAGDAIFYDHAEEELTRFIEQTNIPVLTADLGRGVLPDSHDLCFASGRTIEGGPQLYAWKHADYIMILGKHLDYSVSFGKAPIFGEHQIKVQIDIEGKEIGKSSAAIDIGIIGNTNTVLRQFREELNIDKKISQDKFKKWHKELKTVYESFYTNLREQAVIKKSPVHPISIFRAIDKVIPENRILVLDGSNAMFWGSLLFSCNETDSLLIGPNGTFGPMGTGLPVALGAKIAAPEKTVILYSGDGSLGFNLSEIDSAVRCGIKIVIIVHNDAAWGFCKDTQRCLFGNVASEYATNLGFVSYEKVVIALGGYGEMIDHADTLEAALHRAVQSKTIACINIMTDGVMSPGAKFLNKSLRDAGCSN